MATEKQKQKIVDSLLELAADRDVLAIPLGDIAERAGLSLTQLRSAYDSRVAILEDFARRIDQAVLDEVEDSIGDEPARERLFDVLMKRFDALAAYRAGIRGLLKTARRDVGFAAAMNRITVTSMRWMLAAAGVSPSGPFPALRGYAEAQALAVAWAQVLPVWLEDEDTGLSKTMAALDRHLKNLERVAGVAGRFERVCDRMMGFGRKRRRRHAADDTPATVPPETGGETAAPA